MLAVGTHFTVCCFFFVCKDLQSARDEVDPGTRCDFVSLRHGPWYVKFDNAQVLFKRSQTE